MDCKPHEHCRVTGTLLSKCEKKLLDRIVKTIPRKMTSDYLTWVGLAGALFVGAGYVLTNISSWFIWLSTAGYVINWFGDSLDGTLARFRKSCRAKYGFYIDHNVDAVTLFIIGVGAGLSPYLRLYTALLVVTAYYMLCIHTYINTYLKNEFRLSYAMLGPTEFRLIMIIFNSMMFFYHHNLTVDIKGLSLTIFDIGGILISAIVLMMYLAAFISDLKTYNEEDPPQWDYGKKSQ